MLSRNKWESEFFSKEIYSLNVEKWDSLAFRTHFEHLEPELVEAKVPLEESSKIREMIGEGFTIADTALEFIRQIDDAEECSESIYEVAEAGQIDELKQIAKESVVYSRFDNSFFGKHARQRIYMEWVSNAVTGEFDDVCLVIRIEDTVAGFVTCRKEDKHYCRLGLLAVKNELHGRGTGKRLLKAALCYAINQDCDVLRVSTQYANHPAISFYTKAGFMIDTIDLWLYRI